MTVYHYSVLAAALDLAMAGNPEAQARYAAIYGVAWESLAERYGDDGHGVIGQEIDAAFVRITLNSRMAEAGATGVL